MQWFIDAAKPFSGMEFNVLSKTSDASTIRIEVLAPAFAAITGIKVNHQELGEGEVVQASKRRCRRTAISMTATSSIPT
jgi:glycerol transport system substrate-binding protein